MSTNPPDLRPNGRFYAAVDTLPMVKLATVRHIIRAEQDADIAMELRFSAASDTARTTRNTVGRKIPPQVIAHAFFRINV